jgi:hypothetical protein
VSLCLDESGIPRRFDLYDAAARAALMVDLALAGRLNDEADRLTLSRGSGRPSEDALCEEMLQDPTRNFGWWLARASAGLTEALRDAEQTGHLRRLPKSLRHPLAHRYQAIDAASVALDVERVNRPKDRSLPWDPSSAAVAAIGIAAGVRRIPAAPPNGLVERTETISWLVASLSENLIAIDRRNKATAFAVR